MKLKEAQGLVAKKYQELNQKLKPEIVSLRLGRIEYELLEKFCQKLGISQARFLRICVDHFESYLSSLDEKQFSQELIKIRRFE